MRFGFLSVGVTVLIVLLGCDNGAPTHEQPPPQTEATPAPPPPAAPSLSFQLPPLPSQERTEDVTPEPERPEPEMVSEAAVVGSGKKGHGYGGGMITEPVRAYFRTRERIVFEVTIPNAMKTFKAIDPDGKGPKSHEEFMERIVKENSIELPSLPEGHQYRYDPETEGLMIDRPSLR